MKYKQHVLYSISALCRLISITAAATAFRPIYVYDVTVREFGYYSPYSVDLWCFDTVVCALER